MEKLYLFAKKIYLYTLVDIRHKLILACAFFLLALVCSSQAADNHKQNLNELRQRIQALQKNLISQEKSKREAADALQDSELAISNTSRKLAKLTQEKQKIEIDLKQLQIQHKQIQNSIQTERAQLDKLLYQQYLGNQQDYLRLLFNQQDPNQITRNLHYYKYISQARIESINTLLENQKKLDELTDISQQKQQKIAAVQAQYENQIKQLEKEKIKRQTILSRASKQIAQQQQEINKLKRDEKRITSLVDQISKFLTQREATGTTFYNHKLPQASNKNLPFASLKGRLNLPVRGELVSRFGSPRSGKHIRWKGLFIRSPSGNNVKAIASGQVVFADWLRGFGNLMIVDHGNSYMSLYGNNEALYKQVGDMIHSGDTIATVGNSGGNSDSGLYFELRYQGKPFDPMTWLKIE